MKWMESTMTEEQAIKLICKFFIDNGSRPLGDMEREALKQLVDDSENWAELLIAVALSKVI